MNGPITVRRSYHRFKTVWLWECADHPRYRGYHHSHRFTDRWRAQRGKPPDTHPWARAVAGAVRHWHQHHDPSGPCTCCTHARNGGDRDSRTTADRRDGDARAAP